MRLVTVIPVGAGRLENLELVLESLRLQTRPPDGLVIVEDGPGVFVRSRQWDLPFKHDCLTLPKHEPGMEQPRNAGVRLALALWPETTHVHFLDSDVVLVPWALEVLEAAARRGAWGGTVVAPYDWLSPACRPALAQAGWFDNLDIGMADPRWEMFHASPLDRVYTADLSAGLACFSGNLLWAVDEFQRVGGFWSEIHHGRCEDGELGLRAVAMGVPISMQAGAWGYHLWHPVNTDLAIERNRRDVPMLNARHPWVERGAVFMVDRDGKAFDVRCRGCGQLVPTNGWWEHAPRCGAGLELPVA